MPPFTKSLKVTVAVGILSVGSPPVPGQMAVPAPGGQLWQPIQATTIRDASEDASSVFEKSTKGEGAEQDQQVWRISKGKDHDQLPLEFQWETPPAPVNTPYPVYPFELLRTNVAGKVRAFFVIGPDGRTIVQRIDVTGAPEFGQAVRAMLDACRFTPARKKDGTPAYASIGIEYDFQPKGRSDAPVGKEGRLILRDLGKKPGNIPGLQDLDEPLKPVSRQPPAYPTALRKTGPGGEAEVEFFVDMHGHVQLPQIRSSSAPEFGYAAVQAVAAWRFEPPRKAGKAVVVRVRIPIGFESRKERVAQKP